MTQKAVDLLGAVQQAVRQWGCWGTSPHPLSRLWPHASLREAGRSPLAQALCRDAVPVDNRRWAMEAQGTQVGSHSSATRTAPCCTIHKNSTGSSACMLSASSRRTSPSSTVQKPGVSAHGTGQGLSPQRCPGHRLRGLRRLCDLALYKGCLTASSAKANRPSPWTMRKASTPPSSRPRPSNSTARLTSLRLTTHGNGISPLSFSLNLMPRRGYFSLEKREYFRIGLTYLSRNAVLPTIVPQCFRI